MVTDTGQCRRACVGVVQDEFLVPNDQATELRHAVGRVVRESRTWWPARIRKRTVLAAFAVDLETRQPVGIVAHCALSNVHAVRGLYVLPEYRRRRVGTQLVAAMQRGMESLGEDGVLLAMIHERDMAGLLLFRSLGFIAGSRGLSDERGDILTLTFRSGWPMEGE